MNKSAAVQIAENMLKKNFKFRPAGKRNVKELYKQHRLKARISSLKSKFKRRKLDKLLVTSQGELF